jgi:hypothetical protein
MRSYVPQKLRESQLWKFWDSQGLPLGSPGTKTHLDVAPMERRKVYYKGEGVGFPQVQAVVSLVCMSCPWLVLAPKVLQLCTNHFVLVLCRSVWVSEVCHFFLVSSRSSSTPLHPSIVLWTKERAPTPCLSLFSVWDSHLSPSRSSECVITCLCAMNLNLYAFLNPCFCLWFH